MAATKEIEELARAIYTQMWRDAGCSDAEALIYTVANFDGKEPLPEAQEEITDLRNIVRITLALGYRKVEPGHVIVPSEPTGEMLYAMFMTKDPTYGRPAITALAEGGYKSSAIAIWRAMIAAASHSIPKEG